jgi:hypothetical protein
MTDPIKIALEMTLLAAAFSLFRLAADTGRRRFILTFTALTLVLNLVFYYVAAWPLYASYGQTSGIGPSWLHAFVIFDVIKWGVLAYVLSRLAVGLADAGYGGGFALLRSNSRLGGAIELGIVGGVTATGVVYGLSVIEHRLGYLEALPWSFFGENPDDLNLGLWGGMRNLAGEEILARLGAQSILLYAFRKTRWAPALAIVLSSLYFELWHNGFKEIYFLNFAGSCVFGWVYQKRGYESAAIAHCVADWLALVILPRLLF